MSIHKHKTIPSLDGLRAVSIAIVFAAHAGVSNLLPGGFGVTIFFFLSGYLITTLFYREAEKTGTIDLKGFYIRRLMRLSPPLFLTLGLFYVMVGLGLFDGYFDLGVILSQVFYYFNYYFVYAPDGAQGIEGLAILWSLAVEEHFYLIYPTMFVLLLRGRLSFKHMVGLLGLFLLWRVVRVLGLGSTHKEIYMSTDTRFDAILFGAVLAIAQAQGVAARMFPDRSLWRAAMLLGSLGMLLVTFLLRDEFFRLTLRYTLQSLALVPIFYYAVTRPDLWYFRPLNWLPLRWIGVYSYTIYLCHTVFLHNLLHNSGYSFANVYAFAAIGAVLCVAYAAVMYHGIEKPFKAWWTGLARRRAEAASSAAE